MSSTCFEPEGSSSGKRLYVQVWYNFLHFPEDEPSGSKHVDIVKNKKNSLTNVHFVVYYTMILQCTLQKKTLTNSNLF